MGCVRPARADVAAFERSLRVCGGDTVTALSLLEGCTLAWPASRSLEQQEALLSHAQRIERHGHVLDRAGPLPSGEDGMVALFDARGVALFVVDEGETEAMARRVLGIAP